MGKLKPENFGSVNNLVEVGDMLTIQFFKNEITIITFKFMGHDNSLVHSLIIGHRMDPA